MQTWFPFNVQICLNGREWAARQLRRRRSDFERADNGFTWLGNVELAQRLMGEQLQTAWASDVIFRDPRALPAIYPALVRHAMEHFKSPDVMRFLGQEVHGNFTGEIITSFKNRPEGVRVKHWVRGNSIKTYDKAGSVLRVETIPALQRGLPRGPFHRRRHDPLREPLRLPTPRSAIGAACPPRSADSSPGVR